MVSAVVSSEKRCPSPFEVLQDGVAELVYYIALFLFFQQLSVT